MSDDRRNAATRDRRRRAPSEYVPYAIAIIVALIAAYSASKALSVSGRQGADERRTCMIQRNGLPAGHALAGVISDLQHLVAHPLPSRALRQLPPDVRFNLQWAYHDLGVKAFNYAWLESRQPPTRSC